MSRSRINALNRLMSSPTLFRGKHKASYGENKPVYNRKKDFEGSPLLTRDGKELQSKERVRYGANRISSDSVFSFKKKSRA